MKILYFECEMGAAGDMLTAALLDLYQDRAGFLNEINNALHGKCLVTAENDMKCGIKGTHVHVNVDGHEEGDYFSSNEHHHSSFSDVLGFIDTVNLPDKVKDDAKHVYQILADAEGLVHGKPVNQIHFHEVGTIDAIADILGVCLLIYRIAPDKIVASPVNVGSGTVKCAHGVLPVPVPATELILRGIPIYSGDIQSELCTPTGAALLKYFVSEFGPMPVLKTDGIGYGTGKKDFEQANIVRAILGSSDDKCKQIIELACNIDDMTSEDLGFAMSELFNLGALDVYFTNICMKKSRPGVILSCLCTVDRREEFIRCIFKNTTTLGIREYICNRYCLNRVIKEVETQYGPVRIKTSYGYGVTRSKVEYEDIAGIARTNGKTLFEIRKNIADEFKLQ